MISRVTGHGLALGGGKIQNANESYIRQRHRIDKVSNNLFTKDPDRLPKTNRLQGSQNRLSSLQNMTDLSVVNSIVLGTRMG